MDDFDWYLNADSKYNWGGLIYNQGVVTKISKLRRSGRFNKDADRHLHPRMPYVRGLHIYLDFPDGKPKGSREKNFCVEDCGAQASVWVRWCLDTKKYRFLPGHKHQSGYPKILSYGRDTFKFLFTSLEWITSGSAHHCQAFICSNFSRS